MQVVVEVVEEEVVVGEVVAEIVVVGLVEDVEVAEEVAVVVLVGVVVVLVVEGGDVEHRISKALDQLVLFLFVYLGYTCVLLSYHMASLAYSSC